MKIENTLQAVLFISLATATSAYASEYDAADKGMESKLCVAAATMTKSQMRNTIVRTVQERRTVNGKYEVVANQIVCNGERIADFAAGAGNYEVAAKLASYQKRNVRISDLAKKSDNKDKKDDV